MCGRATLISPADEIAEAFGVTPIPLGPPRFNVAPGQDVAIVRHGLTLETRELALVRWGLVPWWSKDAKGGGKSIQARGETVARAPAFRDAWKRGRCLFVADGFYEWSGERRRGGASRKAHHIRLPGGGPFAIAAVWDSWKSPEGTRLETCAVITAPARGAIAGLHDRMPLLLDTEDRDRWLSSDDDARGVITDTAHHEARAAELVINPVASWVNDVRNDDARCLDPPQPPPLPAQTTLRFE
jgi:putative SOS response-associated peptidase YedK